MVTVYISYICIGYITCAYVSKEFLTTFVGFDPATILVYVKLHKT